MGQRLNYQAASPEPVKAYYDLGKYLAGCGLGGGLLELVKIRASQINGCAFCLDVLTKDACAAGEAGQRIYAPSAWRETPFFSERERAAVAWAEAVTRTGDGVPDAPHQEARRRFGETELADLTWAVVVIDGWNRIAVGFRLVPGHYKPGRKPE